MIDFNKYIGKNVVLITNSFDDPNELSGIRISNSTVFKFQKKWVLARPLTKEDLQDEDFISHLCSIWHHNETLIKSFLKLKS